MDSLKNVYFRALQPQIISSKLIRQETLNCRDETEKRILNKLKHSSKLIMSFVSCEVTTFSYGNVLCITVFWSCWYVGAEYKDWNFNLFLDDCAICKCISWVLLCLKFPLDPLIKYPSPKVTYAMGMIWLFFPWEKVKFLIFSFLSQFYTCSRTQGKRKARQSSSLCWNWCCRQVS